MLALFPPGCGFLSLPSLLCCKFFLSSAYVVVFLFSTSYHFHYACLRDDIEDEQYLFDGVQLTEAEYRELR